MGFVPVKAPRCASCDQPVYVAEQIVHDQKPYHKKCFKCGQCKCQLTALNFAAFDSKLFCKTHFKELLANAGGKYDVAFHSSSSGDGEKGEDGETSSSKKGGGKGSGKAGAKEEDTKKKSSSVKTMANKTNAASAASFEKDTSKDGCVCCERTVYAAEAVNVVVGNKKVHKRCFKCSECLVTLSLNTFVFDKETAKLYCKTHTPKMKAHVGLDGVYGLQKAETKVSHLGGRQVMPKVEQAPKVTIDAIIGHAQPDLRSFSVGRNVMPGNEPKLVSMRNSNNKENKVEKKPEPVDYTSPGATPSSTKKAEMEKKVFTLETPPLTTSVEKKKKAAQQEQEQQKSAALEEKKQQQEAQKQTEKTSHEMSIKKSRSGSRSPSDSLTSAGSEEIAKKQLIEALSSVSIKEDSTKVVDASSIPLAKTPNNASKKNEEKEVAAAGTGTPMTPAESADKKGGDPYAGMTKSQIKRAKERERMRAKEQLKYEKDLEKKARELEIRKKQQEAALASASASSLSSSIPRADPATEPVKVQEIIEQIEPPPPPAPEPSNFYLIKPPGAKTSPDSGELQSKGYELDEEGKLVQSASFSGSESKEKPIKKKKEKKEKKSPAEKFLPAKSEVNMSEEGSKMFKTPPKVPVSIVPPEATKDGKLISPKGENKVSPRRSIGHIAPEPISSPTVTPPSPEVISNSPGSNAKKDEKKLKLKPGEAAAQEEKPKLQNTQVYSFKQLQASGFAFDDENDIEESENDSDSYVSESDKTPRMAQVREGQPTTPSTLNITSSTPFTN